MPDVPVQVPVDRPEADTEWNDILRHHGIIPDKPPSPTPALEEAISQARALAHANRLEGKDLDELDELEDEEDETFLASYRQKRMQELSSISRAVHGTVYPLVKSSYARDVTEASHSAPVIVLLTSTTSSYESHHALAVARELARKYPDIKFGSMQADLCIENYPERNCPTILIYIKGDIVRQIVTLQELGNMDSCINDWEKMLVKAGAVKSSDHRLEKNRVNDG